MARKTSLWDADDCALILIDYQPEMFKGIHSSDPALVELNVCMLARLAHALKIPVVLSTVGVEVNVNSPTIRNLLNELPELPAVDRSSMNAWEDENFLKAVKATGKKRLIFCALWTEICLAFPVIDALQDNYEVAIITDAVGGRSKTEHDTAITRMVHAGAIPNTTLACCTEWFRDWKSPRASIAKELIRNYLSEKKEFEEDTEWHETSLIEETPSHPH